MNQPQPNPAYTPSFEAVVLAEFATVKAQNAATLDWLERLNAQIDTHDERIVAIGLEMAERKNQCPVIERGLEIITKRVDCVETEVTKLSTTAAISRGGLKMMAGVSTAVMICLTAVYHFFGIGKMLAK